MCIASVHFVIRKNVSPNIGFGYVWARYAALSYVIAVGSTPPTASLQALTAENLRTDTVVLVDTITIDFPAWPVRVGDIVCTTELSASDKYVQGSIGSDRTGSQDDAHDGG